MCSGCLKIWRYLLTIYARYKERNIQIPEQSAANIGISLGLLTGLPLSVLEAAKHARRLSVSVNLSGHKCQYRLGPGSQQLAEGIADRTWRTILHNHFHYVFQVQRKKHIQIPEQSAGNIRISLG